VVLWAGGFFFTRAWQSIVNRSLNMFTLIGRRRRCSFMSTARSRSSRPEFFPNLSGAMGRSIFILKQQRDHHTGVVRSTDRGKSAQPHRQAIKALLGLAAKNAHRVRDGQEEEIPVDAIQKGDLLRVRPGERCPSTV